MTYKVLPILFFLTLLNIGCQGRIQQAHETDVKREESKKQVIQSSPKPCWVDNPSCLFPELMFIADVGEGKSLKAAKADAKRELASQFSVSVKGEDVVINARIIDGSGDKQVASVHSEITSGVKVRVNLELHGVKTKETWEDKEKGVFYALAALERDTISTKLNGQIQQIQDRIIEFQKDGERFESENNILKASDRFTRAGAERKKLNPIIQIFQFVRNDYTSYPLNPEVLTSLQLESRVERLTPDQKPKGWENGILSLAQQLIKGLSVNQQLKVEKIDFRDFRSKRRMPFSELVERDLRRHLRTISKISVVVAKDQKGGIKTRDLSLDNKPSEDSMGIEITGSYKKMLRNQGVRIYASLIDSNSLTMGEGVVEIKPEDIDESDFGLINKIQPLPGTQADDRYKLTIEWLLALKQENPQFDFKIWTDKEEYEICAPEACDKVNIFVQSERSGYLYLLDVGTSGNLWMLFPNERMTKSNFIEAGQVIKVPDDYWGSPIWVHEPEGLERVKAILTPEPINWGALDKTSVGFKRLMRGNERGLKDLSLNMNQLPHIYPDMVEATISFFIRKQGDRTIRGTRSIKTPPPKKPMDIIGTMGREKK